MEDGAGTNAECVLPLRSRVGRCVMLKPAAARGKRLPETLVAKICRVTHSGMIASVILQYTANGVTKTYTDSFPRCEAFSTRYIQVQEADAPLDSDCIRSTCSPSLTCNWLLPRQLRRGIAPGQWTELWHSDSREKKHLALARHGGVGLDAHAARHLNVEHRA